MIKTLNKHSVILILTLILSASLPVYATTANVNVTASFLTAININKIADMDWGTVEFIGAPDSSDTAILSTGGLIAYSGDFSGAGVGTTGVIQVTTGDDGVSVNIFCDTTATMTRAGGGSIDVTTVTVLPEGQSDAVCLGLGSAASSMVLDITGGTADIFSFGGLIDGATASGFVAGDYSTLNSGGTPITVNVFYL